MKKVDLRRVAARIKPTDFLDAHEYLAEVYAALKTHDASYSYVQFTEDCGFGACNALYLVIHGQRPLTGKGAAKIAAALDLTGLERKWLLQLVSAQRVDDPSEREAAFDRLVELKTRAVPSALDRRQLAFYNQWYNAAILELLSLPDASDDPAWLAARVLKGVTPLKAEKSLALLEKLGYVTFDAAKGRLVPSQATVTTGPEVVGLAVIRYHQQMIALAKDALTDVAPEDRDVSAVTIAVPASRMPELKERIQKFRGELLALSRECTDADQIAQVNVQLFPLARKARSKRP